ncbi:MAG: hypothetical protein GC162_11595 [Planctomycetes bacterium]|nr:hypothetical protein [Planctomycetota bacterium]
MSSHMMCARRRWWCALAGGLIALMACHAMGKVFVWGDQIIKPPRWPKNSTINIYIQVDPKAQGRDALVRDGFLRWSEALMARMVNINVVIGNPPANATNVVKVTWEADGGTLGPGQNDAESGPTTDGEKLDGGTSKFRNALPAGTMSEQEYLKNLAEHEMTHIIGLADDATGTVTSHTQNSDERSADGDGNLNGQDKKEISALYGPAAAGGAAVPQGNVNPLPPPQLNVFPFQIQFQPANAVPDPNDPEHMPNINFGIDPSIVDSIELPPGWLALVPNGPVLPTDPFFDTPTDGFVNPEPYDTSNPITYIALRASEAQAIIDGLPSGFDPALTVDNPTLTVTFHMTGDYALGLIPVWAGGEIQYVLGPVAIPEPSSAAVMMIAGAMMFRRGAVGRRRSRGMIRP